MDMNLSKFQEIIQDRGAWCTTVHRITKSLSDLATEQQMLEFIHVSTYLFTKHSLTIIPLLGTVLDMKMQQWKTHTHSLYRKTSLLIFSGAEVQLLLIVAQKESFPSFT